MLFDVANSNVEIRNVVSTLIWRCPTSRRRINQKTTLKQRWNVCWVMFNSNISNGVLSLSFAKRASLILMWIFSFTVLVFQVMDVLLASKWFRCQCKIFCRTFVLTSFCWWFSSLFFPWNFDSALTFWTLNFLHFSVLKVKRYNCRNFTPNTLVSFTCILIAVMFIMLFEIYFHQIHNWIIDCLKFVNY